MDKELLRKLGYREDFDWENRFDLKSDVEYKGKHYIVSTVDLGLDHSFGMGKPLYYETMIFPKDDGENEFDWFQHRYSTEKEAKEHHNYIVNMFEKGKWE